jgi:uncharacterized protein GlcG (DUF336 family)
VLLVQFTLLAHTCNVWAVCVYICEAAGHARARGRVTAAAYMACERHTEKTTGRISMKFGRNVLMVHASYLINFWMTLT